MRLEILVFDLKIVFFGLKIFILGLEILIFDLEIFFDLETLIFDLHKNSIFFQVREIIRDGNQKQLERHHRGAVELVRADFRPGTRGEIRA